MRDIHPKYNKITVQFPKGDTFETYSTFSEEKLFLDVDFRKHPAWTKKGVASANESNAKVTKFKEKFGNMSFSTKSSNSSAPAVEKEKKDDATESKSE
ncbi:MAG: 50S ribosomal protein L31 [Alphaproteobacteria bacterium]|nr:50S ribosomal protein L31 [Alphaproteobacteria bacterium]